MISDPRWGDTNRDRKALAILRTLQLACGSGVARGRWLDVGCGSGGIAATLATAVDEVDGIDLEPWVRWKAYMEKSANLKLMVGACDGLIMPRPTGSYSVVVCNQVYEHVSNPRQLLRNIHAMLAPGGICYFAGPNLLWPIEPHVYWPFVHWLPRKLALHLMGVLGSKRIADLDAYSASYWQLRSWFAEQGFESTNAVPERLAAVSGKSLTATAARGLGRLPRAMHACLAPFAPGFVFILRKSR